MAISAELPRDKQRLEALARHEILEAGALQRAIFNSANFSSIATDAKGVIQIFNVGAERMLGYTAAEVVNKITPADISDPQETIARANSLSLEVGSTIAPGFDALVFKAARGIEDIYELTYIRKDGSRFPAVVSVTALRDDREGVIGYLLIGTDNTARKKAETALLKAGALQNAIFNSAYFSCIATDEKGVIQLFNVGSERMLGYAASDVVNKITPAALHDPMEIIARATALSLEYATPIAPGFEALVFKASRGIADIYELTKVRKDGTHFPAVVSVTALRDGQDGIIGYLLIGTDNTARKQAEDAILALNANLDRRVQERTAELKAANGELEAFAYSVSRDLRSPLRGMNGYVRMLQEDCAGLLDAEGIRLLGVVDSEARRMGRLIDDLLAFSRLGRQQMVSAPIDMTALARSVFESLTSPAPELAPRLNLKPLPPAQGDLSMLRQVFANLIGNAVKFSRKQTAPGIEVGGASENGVSTYYVKDNGVGFDPRFVHKLFGVFQRLHSDEEFEGTGVGLALVQRIILRHGGKIWAEGKLGEGATFYFTLPTRLEPRP